MILKLSDVVCAAQLIGEIAHKEINNMDLEMNSFLLAAAMLITYSEDSTKEKFLEGAGFFYDYVSSTRRKALN